MMSGAAKHPQGAAPNVIPKNANQDRFSADVGNQRSWVRVSRLLPTVLVVCILAIPLLRPSPEDFQQDIHSLYPNFLVRDGNFDCTTLYDQVPVDVLLQIPGMVSPRITPTTTNGTTLPGGKTSCSVAFVPTGDIAEVDKSENLDAVTLRNTLGSLALPLDYRSFVLHTAPTCGQNSLHESETVKDPANRNWQMGMERPKDLTIVAESVQLEDDRLGCLGASILFPEGTITDVQSITARRFLQSFIKEVSTPLTASISAEKSGHSEPITAPTFVRDGTFDCRTYLLRSSLNQQREIGLIPDFSRIPGDFIQTDLSDTGVNETPFYRTSGDGSSVTCWFRWAMGSSVATDRFGTVPVSAVVTSPENNTSLPQSVTLSQIGAANVEEASALSNWHYFLYLPGASSALSHASSRLELELSPSPTMNLYRCINPTEPASGQSCMVLSVPLDPASSGSHQSSSTVSPDSLRILADNALRIDPLLTTQ